MGGKGYKLPTYLQPKQYHSVKHPREKSTEPNLLALVREK